MPGTCKVTLVGNVTRTPDITTTKGGAPRCTFGMAVNWKNQDGEEQTDFYAISMVGAVVNVVEKYVTKGMTHLTVFGTLTHRPYVDKEGYQAVSYDVFANDLLLPPKNGNGNGHHEEAPARRPAAAPQAQAAPATEDESQDIDWEEPHPVPPKVAARAEARPPAAKPAVIKTASQAREIADRIRQQQPAAPPAPAARPVRPVRPAPRADEE